MALHCLSLGCQEPLSPERAWKADAGLETGVRKRGIKGFLLGETFCTIGFSARSFAPELGIGALGGIKFCLSRALRFA